MLGEAFEACAAVLSVPHLFARHALGSHGALTIRCSIFARAHCEGIARLIFLTVIWVAARREAIERTNE
jgi:hypothetical protein